MEISIRAFKRAISQSHFNIYREEADDNQKALELYNWNKVASGSFQCILHDFEVVLRFSIDKQLTKAFGTKHWYNSPIRNINLNLNPTAINLINLAKKRIGEKSGEIIKIDEDIPEKYRHKLLSELSFGFWTYLFGSGNENIKEKSERIFDYNKTLWEDGNLNELFPPQNSRNTVFKLIFQINELRNLIAHHEPIFQRDLEKDYQNILMILGWLSPPMRDYTISTTRIPYLLKNRGNTNLLNLHGS